MKKISELFEKLSGRLENLAKSNAVVAKPISVGDRHVIPLCELGVGFGGGGGMGEADDKQSGKGVGGGAGGGAKATPVAVIVVDGESVRIERLGN